MARDMMLHEDHDLGDPNILYRPPYIMRRSPIIVTIADPKISYVDLQKMMKVGMDVVKFETSLCSKGDKIRLLSEVDKANAVLSKKYGVQDWPCTTCLELRTCIVRTGIIEGNIEFITLKEGIDVIMTCDIKEYDKCNASLIYVDNPYVSIDAKVGMIVSISEGEVEMKCINIVDGKTIKCTVIKAGNLSNMNVVNTRGGKKTRPVLEKKDLKIIKFAIDYQVDMLIINYIRQADTIRTVKKYMGTSIRKPIIVAGLCCKEGILNVDEIIKEADGVLFSREHLGYELEENLRNRMMLVQKWITAKCVQAGKPLYISGDLFNQTLANGEFLYGESADVTNALLDGASGFVLRHCSDVELLIDVIKAMNQLCCSVEPLTNRKTDFWRVCEGKSVPVTAAQACAVACAALAHQNNSKVIIIPTVTGDTAKILLWLRPASLVLTVSSNSFTTRRLQSYRCVVSLMYKGKAQNNWETTVKARVKYAVDLAVSKGWIRTGESYVTLQRGTDSSAFCDTVRTWTVTGSKTSWIECPDNVDETEAEKTEEEYFEDIEIKGKNKLIKSIL